MKSSSSTNKLGKKNRKKSTQKRKAVPNKATRIPGIDKGKVIIKPDFDAPLPELDDRDITLSEVCNTLRVVLIKYGVLPYMNRDACIREHHARFAGSDGR